MLLVVITMISTAQPPQGFTYQAALRDSDGAAIANQTATLRISLTNEQAKTIFFVETHTSVTNAQGVVGLHIGQGDVVSGSFSEIP